MSDRSRNISYFAITLTIGALLSIVVARSYIGTRSGFLTLDEAGYFYSVLLSRDAGRFVPVYGNHLAFQGILLLYSVALGINNVFSFLLLGPVLPGLFSIGTILVTYKIVKLLRFSQTVRALTILSMPLFFVFSLMTGFIITESPALFITMVGIYTFLRGQANGDRKSVFGSVAFFIGAALVRETFLLYTLAPIGTLLYSSVRARNRTAALGLVSIIILTLFWAVYTYLWPVPFQTAILFDTLSNYSTGVVYGWSPFLLVSVFFVTAWMVYSVLRRQRDITTVFVTLVVLLSQITLLAEYYVVSAAHGIDLAGYYSSLIRFSFAGLPGAVLCIPFVVTTTERIEERLRGWRFTDLALPKTRIGTRFLAAILLLTLAWNIWQVPTLLSYSQSVLQNAPYEITSTTSTGESGKTTIGPTERFASSYQSPPLRLYRKVTETLNKHPGAKVLVIGCCVEGHMLRARVFLHEYRNVTIVMPPDNKTAFSRLAASYDYTYLFAETFAYYNDTLSAAPRYYIDVLANRTTPKIRLEWESAEGYLYYVIPTGNIQAQQQYYVIPTCPAATLSKRDRLQNLLSRHV